MFGALPGDTPGRVLWFALEGECVRSVKMHFGVNSGAFFRLVALSELFRHSRCFSYQPAESLLDFRGARNIYSIITYTSFWKKRS